MMKIGVILVDILVQLYRGKYDANVVYEKVKKLLYLDSIRAIYCVLQLDLLSYINVRKYFERTVSDLTHMNHN